MSWFTDHKSVTCQYTSSLIREQNQENHLPKFKYEMCSYFDQIDKQNN